ncbi:ABC transporter substrate-binding protein [Ruania halotolerans]|uniref:ABC transporter substrate-binding protein n=1 Tax=Ruania halotolerans TaxID=2897773 RepID=UPI001E453DDA|nr:ABC transporter substrate-binding protein [Ruania halotolerans]UFU07007.1 ABC transporter substrate-binding protein [Ruania halotolerans]
MSSTYTSSHSAHRNAALPANEARRDRSRAPHRISLAAAFLGAAALTACSASGATEDSFTLALIEPDLTTVPLMAAAAELREDGIDVEVVELAEPELAIEGLAQGDYQISAEATSPALIAIERGAPIRIVADVIGNQWAIYSQPDLTTCDSLVDRPVGIFSEGAVATAMVRNWVADECTSGEPEYLVIGGSDVRAQALLAGEIDGTALEVADAVTLATTSDADLYELADFGASLPDLHPQTVYANSDFLGDQPELAQAFIDSLIDIHGQINEDPEVLASLAEEHLGVEADETLSAIAQEYADRGLFDAAALTPENVQGTIDFFAEAGVIDDLAVEDAADLSFLTNN